LWFFSPSGAAYKKHLPIYFYIVSSSVLFGTTFFGGLVSPLFCLMK